MDPALWNLPSPPGGLARTADREWGWKPVVLGTQCWVLGDHTGKDPRGSVLSSEAQVLCGFPTVSNFPFKLLPVSLCISMRMGRQLRLEGPKSFLYSKELPFAPSKSLLLGREAGLGPRGPC